MCHLQVAEETHTHTTVLQPFFRDHLGKPVPEENFWTFFMVQGKINSGRHRDNPAGRYFIRTNQCPPPPSPHLRWKKSDRKTADPGSSTKRPLKRKYAADLGLEHPTNFWIIASDAQGCTWPPYGLTGYIPRVRTSTG